MTNDLDFVIQMTCCCPRTGQARALADHCNIIDSVHIYAYASP